MVRGDGAGPATATATTPATKRRRAEPRRRRDPATARAELLATGLEIAAEQSLGEPLGHLRINDLARAAGLTSGAFYHYWDNQDAYRAAVLDALLAERHAEVDPDAKGPIDPRRPLATLIEERAARAFADRLEDPDHRVTLALWAQDDPALVPRLLSRARAADAEVAEALAVGLERLGRRPAPGWDHAALATALVTLGDGLRSHHLIDPGAAGPEVRHRRRRWGLPGLLTLLVLLGATEDGASTSPAGGRPQPGPPSPPEPARDNPRRDRLVALGVAAARARPTGNAFDHIRADDVTRRLGLTIGAFYHYWETQEDYRDDLVDALFASERYLPPAGLADQDEAIARADDLDAAVRRTTTWYWDVSRDHPDNRIHFAFYALDDPYINDRLAHWNADLRRAWHAATETLLARFERHWRPPLTTELVVTGMGALLDGLLVRHGLDPDGLGPDDDGWTLWGRTCRALVRAGSAPADDDADLPDRAEAVLGG